MKSSSGGWRSRWRWFLGVGLALLCLACQPTLYPSRPAPPPPPPPAPEPPPQRPTLYVNVGRLNLRAGPGMDFPKISTLERNEEVEKLGQTEDWLQVRVKRDGTLGWVASRFLSSTPVSAPPETAKPPPAAPPAVTQPPAPEAAPVAKPPLPERPKPAKPETVAPKAPKPAEATEPPARKPEEKPAPAKEKPKEEPPTPEAPGEKPSGIRIM